MEKAGFLFFRKRNVVLSGLVRKESKESITQIVKPFKEQENYIIKKQKRKAPTTFYSLGLEFLLTGLLLIAFYFLEDND